MNTHPASTWYAIQVDRVLGPNLTVLFPEMTIQNDGRTTILRGAFADQAALHGMLTRIRDLGLTLISVMRLDESSECQP